MALLPLQIQKVIEEFSKLPGIGSKTAERLTFHLLRNSRASPEALGAALAGMKTDIQYCRTCQMITLNEECSICRDPARDQTVVMVVEDPLDVIAFEKAGYRGVYHVLHGVLSPMDGMGPEQLRMKELLARVRANAPSEIILSLNPTVEGEATATYVRLQLEEHAARITRLGSGLPVGADIEFADQDTLKEAIAGRRTL